MILGTGVDLAEVARIREAIKRYGPKFLQRIFTEREISYAQRKANSEERFSARFAAKEAAMKALGTGWRRGVRWKDLEVSNLSSGRPTLLLHGEAKRIADSLGVTSIHLSMTHTEISAIAFVIFEG